MRVLRAQTANKENVSTEAMFYSAISDKFNIVFANSVADLKDMPILIFIIR